jgi:hypothetical protein
MAGALLGPWLWQRSGELSTLVTFSLLAQALSVILLLLSGKRGLEALKQ